jgi:chromosome partitioning protein
LSLLDDFHSSGRISGYQRRPLAKLVSGQKYIVEGQRLEVNPLVDRYKGEMAICRPRHNEKAAN